jgi:hypothetical protein
MGQPRLCSQITAYELFAFPISTLSMLTSLSQVPDKPPKAVEDGRSQVNEKLLKNLADVSHEGLRTLSNLDDLYPL